ncbi:hypothetical protein AcW1_007019 [Taiwanofungus camphoratus]|nr:hypothetical protein AcV5_002822 [Antrodia cinnamomea]KAI0925078.1 hypothetical protein AcW2_005772 [Antrodia cinnamomea]KAI0955432.1 hypothetical protein AcW1_007019 [Antrodia cinnamomea]
MTPTLPIELCEHVIDFLWQDRRALLACALTCRAWLNTSRYHLYGAHHILIRDLSELGLFSRQVIAEPLEGERVRALTVSPAQSRSHILISFPFMLARKLPGLDCLNIIAAHDDPCLIFPSVPPVSSMAISEFTSITKLRMSHTMFSTLTDFGRLICALPNISALTCWKVSWASVGLHPHTFIRSRFYPKLKKIYLNDIRLSSDIVDWLLTATSTASMETIHLHRVRSDDMTQVSQLLKAAGTSLFDLALSRDKNDSDGPAYDEILNNLSLVHNPSLHSIQLRFSDGRHWASKILLQVTSTRLSQISFYVPSSIDDSKLDHFCCGSIDEILAGSRFANLQKLVFEYHNITPDQLTWLRSEIPLRFPFSHSRGIIRYEQEPPYWWPL